MKKAMRYTLLLLSLLFVVSCHNKTADIKIDKFVWIQHKRGWSSDVANWEAKVYIEFIDSCHKVRLAKTDNETKQTEYLIARAPDSLKSFINDIENLQHLYTYTKTDSFDRATIINDYREIIEHMEPLYPKPPMAKEGSKFTPPKVE